MCSAVTRSPGTVEVLPWLNFTPDNQQVQAERFSFLPEPSLAVIVEQSLVAGWSVAVVVGDVGTSFPVLCDGSHVVVLDLHAHEVHGGANLGW